MDCVQYVPLFLKDIASSFISLLFALYNDVVIISISFISTSIQKIYTTFINGTHFKLITREYVVLTKAQINAMQDPVNCSGQTKGGLWNISSMKETLGVKRKSYVNQTREQHIVTRIFFTCSNKWNPTIQKVAHHCTSGTNILDEVMFKIILNLKCLHDII